jgi:hypothetical protein
MHDEAKAEATHMSLPLELQKVLELSPYAMCASDIRVRHRLTLASMKDSTPVPDCIVTRVPRPKHPTSELTRPSAVSDFSGWCRPLTNPSCT